MWHVPECMPYIKAISCAVKKSVPTADAFESTHMSEHADLVNSRCMAKAKFNPLALSCERCFEFLRLTEICIPSDFSRFADFANFVKLATCYLIF